jgi:hypothetical protein
MRKISLPEKPVVLSESPRHGDLQSPRANSGAQTCSAASTTRINNGTAAAGTHSGTKTVTTFAFQYTWLKCSLHDSGFFKSVLWPLSGIQLNARLHIEKKGWKFTARRQYCQPKSGQDNSLAMTHFCCVKANYSKLPLLSGKILISDPNIYPEKT